jgi:hypothetical protein
MTERVPIHCQIWWNVLLCLRGPHHICHKIPIFRWITL